MAPIVLDEPMSRNSQIL